MSSADVRKKERKKAEQYMQYALLGEVYTTPKPGLVDLRDTGAHKDMDYQTFEKSTCAIVPYMGQMYEEGARWTKDPELLFAKIRSIGVMAERAMFQATEGVNTHKGILFTMGITAAAAGLFYQKNAFYDVNKILELGRRMCAGTLKKELGQIELETAKTHGEQLYKDYAQRGIRGEVIDGFPVIRMAAYPMLKHFMKKGENPNQAALQTLLYAMACLGDTNVVSRGGIEGLGWLRENAAGILSLGGVFTEAGREEIQMMNQRCIERNISPGGSADMLALTIFLWELENQKTWNLKEMYLDGKGVREDGTWAGKTDRIA